MGGHQCSALAVARHGAPELDQGEGALVRNGVRHTPEGTAVEVELHREGDEAVVGMRDSGPGVPEADLERIFRPFFRVEIRFPIDL
jgi:K+-sensing histidine kinase KdpD